MNKIKILWISDLVVPTGFARVAHGIIANLPRDKYEITGLGVNYKGDPHRLSFSIYPALLGGDVYGINRLKDIFNRHEFDVIFILNDAWVINSYLKAIKSLFPEKSTRPKIVTYFPVDATNHSSAWYDNMDMVSSANTYTEFGKKVASLACPDKEFGIVPHGIDKSIFYKIFDNKMQARMALYGSSNNKDLLGEDSFIVLNANRNQPRKRLELTMEGFKLFAEDKPSSVCLYMHCGNTDAKHIDVKGLASNLGILKRLVVSGTVTGPQSVPDSVVNLIYNATDVGINTSLGEGWGLVNMEHAITGAPQLVPNHSACAEIFHDCGLLMDADREFMQDGGTMTIGKLVNVESIAESLNKIYNDKQLYSTLSAKAIEKFSDQKYSWSEIAKTWDNIITGVL